jgi:hypothetical protein
LIRELRSEATVLVGRCVSYGEGATYLPVAEMVAQAGGNLESIIGGSSSTGTELVALRAFFGSVARERPAVLVFEDIHWAEPTLLDLIDHLGDRLDAPIFILSSRAGRNTAEIDAGMSSCWNGSTTNDARSSAPGNQSASGSPTSPRESAREQLLAYVEAAAAGLGLARGAAHEPLRRLGLEERQQLASGLSDASYAGHRLSSAGRGGRVDRRARRGRCKRGSSVIDRRFPVSPRPHA